MSLLKRVSQVQDSSRESSFIYFEGGLLFLRLACVKQHPTDRSKTTDKALSGSGLVIEPFCRVSFHLPLVTRRMRSSVLSAEQKTCLGVFSDPRLYCNTVSRAQSRLLEIEEALRQRRRVKFRCRFGSSK